MTKNLKWRLSKLPTVEELLQLVKDKVITQEEAKEVLFSSETEEDRDKDSLKEEIKFLKQVVENLSRNNSARIVEIIREVEKPWKPYPWYQPYQAWCGTGDSIYMSGTTNNTANAGIGTITANSMQSFSEIKSI